MTRELRKKLTLYLNIATLILFIINLTLETAEKLYNYQKQLEIMI